MKSRLIAASLFVAVSTAIAQTPAKALNLSESQKTQIKTIREQGRLTAQPLTSKLRENRQALNAAVKAGDQAQIQSLSKMQGELRGQIAEIRSQARAQMYAGLTNEQRKMLDDRRARIRQRMERLKANRGRARNHFDSRRF